MKCIRESLWRCHVRFFFNIYYFAFQGQKSYGFSAEVHWSKANSTPVNHTVNEQIQLIYLMTHLKHRKDGGKQRGILPPSGHQHLPQKLYNLKSKGENLIFESTVKSLKPAQRKPQYICCLKGCFWKPLSCTLYFGGPVALPAAAIEWLIIEVRPVCLLWLLLSSD